MNMFTLKWSLALVSLWISPILLASDAQAGEVHEVPSAWRLQQYIGGTTNVWFTSSGCSNGLLYMPNATAAEADRFYALVMSAKLANRKVGIIFTDGSCVITSFYIQND